MATQTPKRRDDLHGEEQPEVVFGYKNNPDGHSNGVYDRNEGQVFTARKGSDSVSSDELNDKENSAGSNTTAGSNSALDASEHAFANRVRAAEE